MNNTIILPSVLTGKMVEQFCIWCMAVSFWVTKISLGHLWQVKKCRIIPKEVNGNNFKL